MSDKDKNKQKNKEQKKNDTAEKINKAEAESDPSENKSEPVSELSPEEKLKAENAELNDKFLRLLAEYDNFRKRSQKERDAIYPEAICSVVLKLLPVADSFERALCAECSDPEFKKGVEMIKQSFDNFLSQLGITEIKALGEKFDPSLHNAVMHIEDDSLEENTIVEVFQKGYTLNDRVIRCSMVKVAN